MSSKKLQHLLQHLERIQGVSPSHPTESRALTPARVFVHQRQCFQNSDGSARSSLGVPRLFDKFDVRGKSERCVCVLVCKGVCENYFWQLLVLIVNSE